MISYSCVLPGKGTMMHIKEMPVSCRPQEKLMYAGAGALSDSELLALVIRTGTGDKSAVQLAEDVIAFASANTGGIERADPGELTEVHGIGTAKACSIVAALELSKRLISGRVMENSRISDPGDIAKFLMQEMLHEKRELFMAVHLDTRLRIESKHIVSIGSLDSAPVHPREVFSQAVKRGAAAVIVAHNHPSGDPSPSPQDIAITKRLSEAAAIMGISLLDHIVIGNGKYISLRDEGYLSDLQVSQ